ncbi:MAG: PAS domain S-box protein [Rhodospirillaceae bacterium]
MLTSKKNRYDLRVTIGYAVVATLWILFSDQWLTYLTDIPTVRELSTVKGLAFVVVTSALLFMALRTAAARGTMVKPDFSGMSWPLLTVFLILATAIGTIAFAAFRIQSGALRENVFSGLRAVAELKVDGISRWLTERRANARSLSGSPVIGAALKRWLDTGNVADRDLLADLLRNLCETYSFAGLSILDTDGRPRLGDRPDAPAPATVRETVAEALRSGQPLLLDLVRRESDGAIRLGIIAPLYHSEAAGGGRRALGAIHIDLRPEDFLYPFLNTWPLGSASGESLLARQDGSDVLFLSPLHFRPDAALDLRLPLDSADLPLARALRLNERLIAGRDYRQIPVLAATLPVPGTPWMLVAKMDEEEALAGIRRLLAVTGGLVAAALCAAAAILILLWQQQRLHWAFSKLSQNRQIAASEAKFRSYIEYSPLAVFVVDETGRFVETNPAGLALVGHDAATLLTLGIADVLSDHDRTRALADFASLLRDGMIEAEYQARRADGETPYILVRAVRISETHLIGFCQDVTERRRVEQALRQAQELARLGSYGYDIVSNRWTSSEVLDTIFGIGADFERTADSWLAIVHPAQRAEMSAYLATLLECQRPFDAEYRINRVDTGEERWVHGLGRFDCDPEQRPLRLIGTIQDITERKQAQAEIQALNADLERRVDERTAELSAANRELDSFAYAVSHDLRAPLRAMGGFSAALIEDFGDQLTQDARVYLGHIITAARKMGDLVDGLLVLSRCTRGEIVRHRVDLSALAGSIQRDLGRAFPDRRVVVRIEPGLRAWGDTRMIEVVLRNLLSNAWKYTAHAAAAEISVHSRHEEGRFWICVTDNGAGFAMAHADKLFKPFQRLHREDEFPGIGIGLATVQRIIHRHGGAILGESAVGQGATFRFFLPAPAAVTDAGPTTGG